MQEKIGRIRQALERAGYGTADVDDLMADAQALADVAYLDEAARRIGTDLDIPAQLPGIDEDHAHFVMVPIGAKARRAAVVWLKARGGIK